MFRDRVEQITKTSGSGVYTLDSSVSGKRTFAGVFSNGAKIVYTVVKDAAWECNFGTLNTSVSPPTLSRDRLISSSTGSAIVWPDASDKAIFNDVPAELLGPAGGQLITAAVGGTVNAVTLATNVDTPVYVDGLEVEFEAAGMPTAAVTAAINALAAKPVLYKSGDAAGHGAWEGTARVRLKFDLSLDAWIVQAGHRPGWNKGADIASAATLAKPADARDGSYHRITGSTTIANLWTGAPAGIEHEFEAVAGFTLTNGANLIVPGGDATFVAGDRFRVRHVGSNVWFVSSVMLANGRPFRDTQRLRVATGTTDTITAADDGFFVFYTNAAGCTVTLPDLDAINLQLRVRIINASSGDVTLNRTGTKGFDGGGAAVKVQPSAGRNVLDLQGAGSFAWFTSERRYRSPGQSIASAAQRQVAHGLGAIPRGWCLKVVCATAELGFSVGDEIIYPAQLALNSGAGGNAGAVMRADATNLTLRFGSIASGHFGAPRPDTGVGANLTNGNWNVVMEAWF